MNQHPTLPSQLGVRPTSELATQFLSQAFGWMFAGCEWPQAKAVAILPARNEEFLVGPGAPTVVTADTLLSEVKIESDGVAAWQLKGVLARIKIFRAVVESIRAQLGFTYGEQSDLVVC